jgi:hypothetical protein
LENYQCLQPKDGLGYGWVFLKILGFGWVLGFLKKNCKFSGKIVMKEEKNLIKSFNSSNLLQSIGLQCWEKPWFHQKPTKIFDGQPLQHKIVRLLNAGPRTDPTDLWKVGPKSVDDGF